MASKVWLVQQELLALELFIEVLVNLTRTAMTMLCL